jgi:hypothetical protein
MAKSTPSEIEIWYDDSGGTPVDISQYVQSFNGIEIENIIEETHTFGDSFEENTPIGIGRVTNITLEGLYDDVAGGPHELFGAALPTNPNSPTRTFKVVWGNGKSTTLETILVKYNRTADRSALTRFTAELANAATAPIEV